jgi:long-chain acyl-CoA synthetase
MPSISKLPNGLDRVTTLSGLFAWRVAQTPQGDAYLQYDKASHTWRPVSWQDMGGRVEQTKGAMESLQLQPGSRIAILLNNGLDAVCIDQAALALSCVPVPMHALDNPASIAYILADSDASMLVAQSAAQWLAIAQTGVALPSLTTVLVADDPEALQPHAGPVSVVSLVGWLKTGLTATASSICKPPQASDLAALVYTSGTTGKPKGVMLTHENVLENVKATLARVAALPSDVFLSFLPLSHTFERTAGYYLPIAAGSCVAHARSVALLSEDMKAVRPTILISVPRIYERVYGAVRGVLAPSKLKTRLFGWAQSVGWRRFCRTQHLPVPGNTPAIVDAAAWPLLERLVARPLMDQFGGRLRAAVSGGAALSQPIAHCFLGLGLPLLQGYGMTETSPVVAANALDDNDPATIGRALAGVQVRIGENHELQVRGKSVMRGYWKREADTAAAFADGWLRTGDQAAIEDGRIRILGRIKEIIVTSTGEKVAPSDLEQIIVSDPLFQQAYVFGDNRPFIGCVVVLDGSAWPPLAAELQVPSDDPKSLQSPATRQAVLQRIRALTDGFAYYAQPRAVCVTLEPWTSENSLLTPTLKLKRNNLASHFAGEIDQIYRR